MRLVGALLLVSLLAGLLFGGRIQNLADLHLRWWGLAFVGLGLQLAPYPASWGRAVPIVLLLVSFLLLLGFALVNRRLPGFPVIVVGVLLNFIVISANWGMPVSREALIRSGQEEVLETLEKGEGQKHHLATEDDVLRPLGDVIPVGTPINLAISVGDVVMYAGVAWLIVVTMRSGASRAAPPTAPASSRRHPRSTGDGTEG